MKESRIRSTVGLLVKRGRSMSRKWFLCLCLVHVILLSGVLTLVFQPAAAIAAKPDTPSNVSPADRATAVSLTPTLESSAFFDSDSRHHHAASQWQITTIPGDYSSPVFDSVTYSPHLTSTTVPAATLSYSTTYYWHVRYKDSSSFRPRWSNYSPETSFTTVANQPPGKPVNVLPTGSGVSLTPKLQASAYSDPEGDPHAASQWQVTTGSGDYSNPVFASVTYSPDLTSTTVPVATLSYSTTYYWHVRYVDTYGGWSAYSNDTSFTTVAAPAMTPTVFTGDATGLGTTSASLNGNLISMGTAGSVTVSFVWGTTSGSYPNQTAGQAMTGTGSFYCHLGGLTLGTTYYYKAKAVGDGTSYGDEKSLTTASTITPLRVDTDHAINLTTSSAQLNGCLPSLGTATSVRVSFVWGTTSGVYDNETAPEVRTVGDIVFYCDLRNLASETTYYFRAKAVGDRDPVYGMERSFTTRSLAPSPNQPSNVSPATHAINVSVTPTLQSSAFADLDRGTHTASQWQITSVAGDYSSPVFDSGTDASNLTSVTVPALSYSTTYCWRVRYRGSHEDWSSWSVETSFTTSARPAVVPGETTSGGLPTWTWVPFGIGAAAVLGALVYLAFFRKQAKQQ